MPTSVDKIQRQAARMYRLFLTTMIFDSCACQPVPGSSREIEADCDSSEVSGAMFEVDSLSR